MLSLPKHLYLFLSGLLLVSGCGEVGNNSQAERRIVAGKPFVLLTGQRRLMVHDPLSALFNKTFKDSILLPLPQTERGTLSGHLIPYRRGDYGYKGEITVNGGILKVNLFYNDTDYGSNSPVSWNGEYQLIRP